MIRIEILNLALVSTHGRSWESFGVKVNMALDGSRTLQKQRDGIMCMAMLLDRRSSVCNHSPSHGRMCSASPSRGSQIDAGHQQKCRVPWMLARAVRYN
jgi:hypothetical protein